MTDRFIVDFKIASAERTTLFSPNWKWPIAQSEYDDLIREFVYWTQGLRSRLAIGEDLSTALSLIEVHLLRDLAAIACTQIEVSVAKQNNLELVFSDNHPVHEMITQDEYRSISPTSDRQQLRERAQISKKRVVRRAIGKKVLRMKTMLTGIPKVHSISTNTLSRELTNDSAALIRINHADVAAQRVNNLQFNPNLSELSEHISTKFIELLTEAGHDTSEKFVEFIGSVVSSYLNRGWQDRTYQPEFTPTPSMTLFTGSGGNYLARLLSRSFSDVGGRVIRTTHGGDSPLFDDPLWPTIDLPFATDYVAFGNSGAREIKRIIIQHQKQSSSTTTLRAYAGGSQFHSRIPTSRSSNRRIETVQVIASSFMGELRAVPNVCLPDVVYYEWHRRILSTIKSAGFTTISKRHPKGLYIEREAYEDVASEEIRQSQFKATFNNVDAYVLDIAGSAFMEAMCTLKPVVLIHIPIRRLTESARAAIRKSAQLIDAQFDEQNRVVINEQELIESINAPIDVEARMQFVSDYLTSSSENISEIRRIIK